MQVHCIFHDHINGASVCFRVIADMSDTIDVSPDRIHSLGLSSFSPLLIQFYFFYVESIVVRCVNLHVHILMANKSFT